MFPQSWCVRRRVTSPLVRSGSGRWSALSGACCPGARAPPLPAPALAALLPPAPPRTRPLLLLLAGGEIHSWTDVEKQSTGRWRMRRPRHASARADTARERGRVTLPRRAAAAESARGPLERTSAHAAHWSAPQRTPHRTHTRRAMSRLAALRLLHAPLRAASRSCAGEIPPPAKPPCARRPRTPCRPPPACRDSIAEGRVCCAPPRARQPPCPARPPAAPRTCASARSASSHAEACEEPCGGQDRVALRLAAADDARRRQYEEEAAQRAACGAAPPPTAEYAPGAARDCLRAVDGRTYSLPCRLPPLARCGPGREPPPSRAVPLARQPGCRLERQPDPCAHRPPVFLHVDRSSSLPSPAQPPAPAALPEPRAPGACGPPRLPPRGLTERIVSGLRGERPPERSMHTAARAGLREAGLGRARVPCAGGVAPAPSPAAGRLELAVPAGASRVNVLVTMSAPGGGRCARGGKGEQPPAPPRRRASWLSISSIRRKFAGCGGGSDPPAKKPSKCPSTPSPCRPAAPACPPRPPATPPKRRKAPPCPCQNKPSPCDKPASKTKFYPLTAAAAN